MRQVDARWYLGVDCCKYKAPILFARSYRWSGQAAASRKVIADLQPRGMREYGGLNCIQGVTVPKAATYKIKQVIYEEDG